MRGNADGFSSLGVPEGTPLLNWVHGSSASDIWVGGLSGALLHWDGSSWSDHSVDMDEAFWGLYVVSPSEAYAVGGLSGWGGDTRVAMRYDGTTWTDISLPAELDESKALFKVHHDGTDIWMVGAQGAALVGDGDQFEPVATGVTADLSTIHSRGDGRVFAVGGQATGVIVSGTRAEGLSEVAQAPARLFGVHALGSGDVIVSGFQGYLGRLSAEEALVPIPTPTSQILHAVFGHDGKRLYAVGGNIGSISDDFTGVILTSKAP